MNIWHDQTSVQTSQDLILHPSKTNFHPPGDSMVSESAKPKAAHATTLGDDAWEDGRWCFPKKWLKLQSNTPNFGDIMILKVYEKYAELEKYMLQYFKFKGPKLGKLGIWPTMVTNCTVRKVFQEVSSIFLGAEKCHNLNISHWEEVEFSALQKGVKFHSPTIFTPPDIFSQIHQMLRCPNRQEAEEWEETRLGWGFEDP